MPTVNSPTEQMLLMLKEQDVDLSNLSLAGSQYRPQINHEYIEIPRAESDNSNLKLNYKNTLFTENYNTINSDLKRYGVSRKYRKLYARRKAYYDTMRSFTNKDDLDFALGTDRNFRKYWKRYVPISQKIYYALNPNSFNFSKKKTISKPRYGIFNGSKATGWGDDITNEQMAMMYNSIPVESRKNIRDYNGNGMWDPEDLSFYAKVNNIDFTWDPNNINNDLWYNFSTIMGSDITKTPFMSRPIYLDFNTGTSNIDILNGVTENYKASKYLRDRFKLQDDSLLKLIFKQAYDGDDLNIARLNQMLGISDNLELFTPRTYANAYRYAIKNPSYYVYKNKKWNYIPTEEKGGIMKKTLIRKGQEGLDTIPWINEMEAYQYDPLYQDAALRDIRLKNKKLASINQAKRDSAAASSRLKETVYENETKDPDTIFITKTTLPDLNLNAIIDSLLNENKLLQETINGKQNADTTKIESNRLKNDYDSSITKHIINGIGDILNLFNIWDTVSGAGAIYGFNKLRKKIWSKNDTKDNSGKNNNKNNDQKNNEQGNHTNDNPLSDNQEEKPENGERQEFRIPQRIWDLHNQYPVKPIHLPSAEIISIPRLQPNYPTLAPQMAPADKQEPIGGTPPLMLPGLGALKYLAPVLSFLTGGKAQTQNKKSKTFTDKDVRRQVDLNTERYFDKDGVIEREPDGYGNYEYHEYVYPNDKNNIGMSVVTTYENDNVIPVTIVKNRFKNAENAYFNTLKQKFNPDFNWGQKNI